MNSKLQEEKAQKVLKHVRNLPENKKCMDCTATFPQYVIMDYGTWVCATCSGIHREFNHKVKSPTMSSFKPEEIDFIQNHGNEIARQEWRVNCDYSEPLANSVDKIRDYIRMTYVDQKWRKNKAHHVEPSSSASFRKSVREPSVSLPAKKPDPAEAVLISWDEPTPTPAPAFRQPEYFSPSHFVPSVNPVPSSFNPFDIPTSHPVAPASNPFAPSNFTPQFFTTPTPAAHIPESRPTMPQPPVADLFDFLDPKPVKVTVTQEVAYQPKDRFDFTGLHGKKDSSQPADPALKIEPPPVRPNLSVRSSVRDISPTLPVPKSAPASTGPACPICGNPFMSGASNAEINQHVDECLNKGFSKIAMKPQLPEIAREESWSQWFALTKAEWYYGDIDRKEAEAILSQCTEDSFLVRKSSVKDAFAISLFDYKKQTCTHTLIEHRDGGFAFQHGNIIYSSIADLITRSPEVCNLKPATRKDTF